MLFVDPVWIFRKLSLRVLAVSALAVLAAGDVVERRGNEHVHAAAVAQGRDGESCCRSSSFSSTLAVVVASTMIHRVLLRARLSG